MEEDLARSSIFKGLYSYVKYVYSVNTTRSWGAGILILPVVDAFFPGRRVLFLDFPYPQRT